MTYAVRHIYLLPHNANANETMFDVLFDWHESREPFRWELL